MGLGSLPNRYKWNTDQVARSDNKLILSRERHVWSYNIHYVSFNRVCKCSIDKGLGIAIGR